MLVIILQNLVVCNLNKIVFLNRLFHGEAENFLYYPSTPYSLYFSQDSKTCRIGHIYVVYYMQVSSSNPDSVKTF